MIPQLGKGTVYNGKEIKRVEDLMEEENNEWKEAAKNGQIMTICEIMSKIDWKKVHKERVEKWDTNEELNKLLFGNQ